MPTSYVVLDSGILLATAQTETHTDSAKMLLKHLSKQNKQFAAPILLHYEVVAVTRKWVYRQITTKKDAQRILEQLFEYPVKFYHDKALLRRGYELATLYDRPTAYDAQYLAVAERLSCNFWTIDERLFNAVHEQFSNIHWLGNFKSGE